MLKTGNTITGYVIVICFITFCGCRGGVKSNTQTVKAIPDTTAHATKADSLTYIIPGELPNWQFTKAENWAAKKYGFTISHPGGEVNDSMMHVIKINNDKLFARLNKLYHIPDDQSLHNVMMQYIRAEKNIFEVIRGYLKEVKIGVKDNHYADLNFKLTDSTQKEFMVTVYDVDGNTGKRTGNAEVLRVNTETKHYLAHPDL